MRRTSTYRTNAELQRAVAELTEQQGVTPRRRSAWLRAAIARLFEDDPRLVMVGVGDRLEEYPESATVVIDEATEQLIERAYRIVRTLDPRAEGVMSALIRAAIRNEVRRAKEAKAA